jgi:hypothetical protein
MDELAKHGVTLPPNMQGLTTNVVEAALNVYTNAINN